MEQPVFVDSLSAVSASRYPTHGTDIFLMLSARILSRKVKISEIDKHLINFRRIGGDL